MKRASKNKKEKKIKNMLFIDEGYVCDEVTGRKLQKEKPAFSESSLLKTVARRGSAAVLSSLNKYLP